ncbi:MAG: adenosylmethionine decarboxylase [Candidatus Hodarchaeales archaeon]
MSFEKPESFYQEIASRASLIEGIKGVEKVVITLYRYKDKKISNKELSRIVKLPVPVLSAVRGELRKTGFLNEENRLSDEGLDWLEKEAGLKFSSDFFSSFTLNYGLNKEYLDFFKPVIKYLELRPGPDYELDQSRSTPKTVLKRALIMLRNGDVEGKRIVLLGDDDGLSIALAYLACAKEILVLEIDERIVNYINSFAENSNLKKVLRADLCDVRKQLPDKLLHKYDCFETDPPYTFLGFKVFISQAAHLLKLSTGSGYISFGSKNPFDMWKCQQEILQQGFMFNEFIRDFNRYQGATIIGNTSNLFVISKIPQKQMLYETKNLPEEIYTYDEKKTKDLPTIGYQIISEFYGVKKEYLDDLEKLTSVIEKGVEVSKLKKEETFKKEYSPFGLSVIVILVESHIHVHTWPEWDYLSLDIFVCEAMEKAENLFQFLRKTLDPLDYHRFQFYRGKLP